MAILAVLPAPGHASPTTQATFTVYNVSLTVTPSVVVSNFLPVSGLVPIAANVTALSPTGVYPQSCALGAYTPANSQTCTLCPAGTYSITPASGSSQVCTAPTRPPRAPARPVRASPARPTRTSGAQARSLQVIARPAPRIPAPSSPT